VKTIGNMILLKYGNTNTFWINGLLIDTDYAGTLGAFYKAIKQNKMKVYDLKYVLATHYHPDHCGLIGELQCQGVELVLMEEQVESTHFPDTIFQRDGVDYVPVEEKKAKGEWGNTWRVRVNPRNTDEGLCFELVGCPLADYAKTNGYEDLLPYMCASDHVLAELMHAKLIRTHTCATGGDSCDYWYVADGSDTAKAYADVKMV
jgi:hypothetical protein